MTPSELRRTIEARRDNVVQRVLAHVEGNHALLVLKAPPGSGKTWVTTRAVALARHRGRRVAVATQTNAQAEDFCRRMAEEFPRFAVHRWASAGRRERPLGASVRWVRAARDLPVGPGVVVSTSAKWGTADLGGAEPFDVLFVDEAWQLCWADFMLFGAVAPRFVLVGDPGQIPPVVPIDVSRWQTSRRPPHVPAPEVVLRDRTLPTIRVELPVTMRLPHDTCALVRAFYDFPFDAWALPGERRIEVAPPASPDGVDRALAALGTGSVVLYALPTPDAGPALEEDLEVARAAAAVVRRALERGATVWMDGQRRPLTAADVGVSATHRVMNTRIADALGDLAGAVRVDTPERWQGLERPMMVVVHPLSGVTDASVFDLSTGRLCVMTSRHRAGLVIVSRDHVGATLARTLPRAEQCLGQRDEAGRGRAQHRAVWEHLHENGRVVRA